MASENMMKPQCKASKTHTVSEVCNGSVNGEYMYADQNTAKTSATLQEYPQKINTLFVFMSHAKLND